MKTKLGLLIFLLATACADAQTNNLTSLLQQGLFEEQANRNLDAAISNYQTLAGQFDQDRQLAATAVFRIGECYRMQGKTNEAAGQYQRVLRDFSDQTMLATLSRQNLAGLGVAATATVTAGTPQVSESGRQEQIKLLEEEIGLVEQELDTMQKRVKVGNMPPDVIPPMQEKVLELKRQLAALQGGSPAAAQTIAATDEEEHEIRRIQELIQNSPDLINAGPEVPLRNAAHHGWIKVATFLLDHGADVNLAQGGVTALVAAANAGNRGMVELLLSRGAEVNALGGAALNHAAGQGFQAVTEALLAAHADVNAVYEKMTPLHAAVANGRTKIVQLLLAAGANVNAKDASGSTPLMYAMSSGSVETVRALLAAGANANVEDGTGRTPLSYAADNGRPEIVKMLLDAKGNANGGKLDLPLLGAIRKQDEASARLLLEAGANPNLKSAVDFPFSMDGGAASSDPSSDTPLFYAVYAKQLPMVNLLLKFKADPNDTQTDGRSLLFGTLSNTNILKSLLDAGANPNVEEESGVRNPSNGEVESRTDTALRALLGRTARGPFNNAVKGGTLLSYAVENSSPESVRLLLNAKADPNGDKSYSPLLIAINKKDAKSTELLLQAGANPNEKGAGNWALNYPGSPPPSVTPLFLAIFTKQPPMVDLLLKFKADPNDAQTDGRPILFSALPDTAILTSLLDAGAKVDAPGLGAGNQMKVTALSEAAWDNNSAAVETLLQHGANPNARSPDHNWTPLHFAASQLADRKIFELLLAHKADRNARDESGQSPLDFLKEKAKWDNLTTPLPAQKALAGELADLLRQHGALDNLPNWDFITVGRAARNYSSVVFRKGSNDWNHFTVLDAILNEYLFHGNGEMPFPDLAHVTIVRPSPTSTNATRMAVNLLNGTNGIDCAKDVPLEFGDVVEIPERDHSLGDRPVGLSIAQNDSILNCLKGSVQLVVRGQKVEIPLYPNPYGSLIGSVLNQSAAQQVLLSSSDLSRVKVSRNSKSGEKHEWILDCSEHPASNQPVQPGGISFPGGLAGMPGRPGAPTRPVINPQASTDLWLRDGDVVEVPEKE